MPDSVVANMRGVLAGTIVVYLGVMYVISYYAQKQIRDETDYLVAGRRLPLSLAWMTLLATWFGAGTMLTATDEVRAHGLRAAALDPFGAGICLLLAGRFVAIPMWQAKVLTVPDFFGARYGKSAEWISSLILVPSYFGWIAVQFVALAHLQELLFDIPLFWGTLIVACVGTGYTVMGGMWSVTITDSLQIALVLLGLVVLAIAVLCQLGDGDPAAGAWRLWSETPPHHCVIVPTERMSEFLHWISTLCIGALGNLPVQDLMQRIFASKSARVSRQACYVAGCAYLTFGMVPLALGLASNILLPDSVQEGTMAVLAQSFLHPAVSVVFMLVLISAVLSTIDSALLSPAGVIARNLLASHLDQSPVTLTRLCVVAVAAGSWVVAYVGESAYGLLEGAYAMTLVGLVVPLLFGIYARRASPRGGILSMCVGIGTWGAHYFSGYENFGGSLLPAGLNGIPMPLGALACSLATYVVVAGTEYVMRLNHDS